ncbi:hypothetical protein BMS3Abin07_00034 [bacterium BMS3Abin07]|nr:hypothetical protein BMS3Abin07_00034 [bacterium BMS3Abin07]
MIDSERFKFRSIFTLMVNYEISTETGRMPVENE